MATFGTEGAIASPLALPDEAIELAQAMAGEKVVDVTDDRQSIMEECAVEIEKAAGQLFWDGPGDTARRTMSEIDLTLFPVSLAACPLYPQTGGSTVTLVSVESWNADTAAWVTFATDRYRVRSGGRLRVPRDGGVVSRDCDLTLRIMADILPMDPRPKEADEALARLFALRENRRPGAGERGLDADGRILNLDNALRRSGAREVLDSLRTSWPA